MTENLTPARLDDLPFRIRTHPSVPRDRAYLIPDIFGTADLDLDLEPGQDVRSWHQVLAALAALRRVQPATTAVVHISEP